MPIVITPDFATQIYVHTGFLFCLGTLRAQESAVQGPADNLQVRECEKSQKISGNRAPFLGKTKLNLYE